MKKFLFIILLPLFALVILTFSCESKADIKENIETLRNERTSLEKKNSDLQDSKDYKESQILTLNEQIKELNIIKSGRTPKYVLGIKLKQSHFSLDIEEHIKDEVNAIEIEIPVDKEYYNSLSVGSEIVDEFRVGSFIFNGSLGDWEMTVEHKYIK